MCNFPLTTLKGYSSLVSISPCDVAGIGSCFSNEQRSQIIESLASAESLVGDFLYANRGIKLFGDSAVIKSPTSTVCIPRGAHIGTRRVLHVTAAITGETVPCNSLVTLTATIPALEEGEEIKAVIADDQGCRYRRFGVEFCSMGVSRDVSVARSRKRTKSRNVDGSLTITLTAEAYNFVDYDQMFPGASELTVPYLSQFNLCVIIEKTAVPRVFLQKLCQCGCSPCLCEDVSIEGCLLDGIGCKKHIQYKRDMCFVPCYEIPKRFEVDIVYDRVWDRTTQMAIVRWANTLMPGEVCSTCSQAMTIQWQGDNMYPEHGVIKFGEIFARRTLLMSVPTEAGGI